MVDTPNLHYDIWRAANALEKIAAQYVRLSTESLDSEGTTVESGGEVPQPPTGGHPPVNVSRRDKAEHLKMLILNRELPKSVWKHVNTVKVLYQLPTLVDAVEAILEMRTDTGVEPIDDLYEQSKGA